MSNPPKITVVIPTRERSDVLVSCLRSVTSQRYDNLQIIVSDNASEDRTRDVVEATSDPRVRYVNPGRRVSMAENWEFALSHVDEGWVTVIGDDDGLPLGVLDKVGSLIEQTGVLAIRSTPCAYAWPSDNAYQYGNIIAPTGNSITIRDTKKWLSRVLAGRSKYTELPMIYNGGYAHISVLTGIRDRTGKYFSSCAPDVYSAVAIASAIEKYAFTQEPLAITGTSRHSTGTSYYSTARGTHTSPRKRFAQEENISFHEEIPLMADGSYPLSLQVLVYESYLQSSRLRTRSSSQHSEQLAIIMATSGKHHTQVEAWGKLFASMHELDFDAALREAHSIRPRILLQSSLNKLIYAIRSRSAGSADSPLLDVSHASAAVGILRNPPHLFSTLRRELLRLRNEGDGL